MPIAAQIPTAMVCSLNVSAEDDQVSFDQSDLDATHDIPTAYNQHRYISDAQCNVYIGIIIDIINGFYPDAATLDMLESLMNGKRIRNFAGPTLPHSANTFKKSISDQNFMDFFRKIVKIDKHIKINFIKHISNIMKDCSHTMGLQEMFSEYKESSSTNDIVLETLRAIILNLLRLRIVVNYDIFYNCVDSSPESWNIIDLEKFRISSTNMVEKMISEGANKQECVNKLISFLQTILLSSSDIYQKRSDGKSEFVLPEKIQKSIKNSISATNITVDFFAFIDDFFDDLPEDYKRYSTDLKTCISNSLHELIFLTVADLRLTTGSKLRFLPKDCVVTGFVADINSFYKNDVISAINRIDELIDFVPLYKDSAYPPVPLTSQAVDRLNTLFQKVFNQQKTQMEFTKEIMKIITTTLSHFQQLIYDGIMYAHNTGTNVLEILYDHCKNNLNVLVPLTHYRVKNCVLSPSSKYFLQTLDDLTYAHYVSVLGFDTSSPFNHKYYNTYFGDLSEMMIQSFENTSRSMYVEKTISIYGSKVSSPIENIVFRSYANAFYSFLKV
jgi:hypothetical protein